MNFIKGGYLIDPVLRLKVTLLKVFIRFVAPMVGY